MIILEWWNNGIVGEKPGKYGVLFAQFIPLPMILAFHCSITPE
jgi:hypothetical protein